MKEEVLNLAELLAEAEGELKQRIKNEEEKEQLLIDMQATAISIGSEIEKIEGEGTRAVACLEEYCELLYQCSISEKKEIALKVYESITDTSQEFHKLFIEIAKKKEIVFFPYKASMWDSLESVWLAAKNNPQCRVYVVPIPYYDKNKDGSFGQQHYEGTEFPNYVPVTAWEEYQVAERKPDIIFIHNPYDNGNHVSSVHPDYYAKNLKKYTDMLVYIPYFLLGEDIYEEFCVCAGTIHAHKIILQSERVRAVYIRNFKEFVKENHLEVLFPTELIEAKFVALGSPKIDKAVNCEKENYVLPRQWKRLLNGKKAVLYNTGLAGVLNGNEYELEKIEDVIQSFQNKNDVVLWWRPHPLEENAYASMRPQLLTKYKRIIEEYKRKGIGIYDDTADLYRAIACTDMYYGDESSLVYLYGVQGKPIVLQNFYQLLNKDKIDRSICFNDCAYENGTLWFMPINYNGLYQVDIRTGDITFLAKIPDEIEITHFLYSKIVKYYDELWLIPCMASALVCYHLKNRTFEKYVLGEENIEKEQRMQYTALWENKIVMISADYLKIVLFSLETKITTVYHMPKEIIEKIQRYPKCNISSFPKICMVNEKCYFMINNTNLLLVYNLENKQCSCFEVGHRHEKYEEVIYDGHFFWLIPYRKEKIMRWDFENPENCVEIEYPKKFQCDFVSQTALYKEGFLWIFPARGNMILKINVNTLEVKTLWEKEKKYDVYFAQEIENGNILFSTRFSTLNHQLIVMDNEGNSIIEWELQEPMTQNIGENELFEKLDKKRYNSLYGYYIYETQKTTLDQLIRELTKTTKKFEKEKECFLQVCTDYHSNAGEEIMQHVLQAYERKKNVT